MYLKISKVIVQCSYIKLDFLQFFLYLPKYTLYTNIFIKYKIFWIKRFETFWRKKIVCRLCLLINIIFFFYSENICFYYFTVKFEIPDFRFFLFFFIFIFHYLNRSYGRFVLVINRIKDCSFWLISCVAVFSVADPGHFGHPDPDP